MDDNRKEILTHSLRIISKLQILAAFFADDIIYKVFLRTQVIHQLFENSEELDVNKLELFHLQFTETVVELLKKIKKSNEKSVSILVDEMHVNNDLIASLESEVLTEASFKLEMQRQSLKINTSLRRLYQELSDDTSNYPFSKNINQFSARYANEFYFSVESDVLMKLIEFEPKEVYTNAHAIIQRKLMGLLCKYDFKSAFFCGLKTGNLIIEVYKIIDTDIFYIFYPTRNLFLLCDADEMKAISKTIAVERHDNIVDELKNKNDQLLSNIAVAKTNLPANIRQLMADHYKKISDVNFMQNIANFDAQANILKAMLNTDMM
ncbi:hypothetical protein FPZ43_04870 [Mucilaginibacter pallidiroseus]|uniref:Uncharacterized protein n=1 Tax=Mucilaginibacter pallidiroseus TaxID=2599295 RepID=A0A563UFY8_9SPHI|nr:hypothetical protein [Mucilaginibacter pallidiroseus]TWR30274.1 hypothetical protein FPZ43_04870 [Mucilaginibacter pallidiroseus]